MRLLPATLGQVCSARSKHGCLTLHQYTCLQWTHVGLSALLSVEEDSPELHYHHLRGRERGRREGEVGGRGEEGKEVGERSTEVFILLVVAVALVVATYIPLSSSSRRSYLTPVLLSASLAILQKGQYVFEKTTTLCSRILSSTSFWAISVEGLHINIQHSGTQELVKIILLGQNKHTIHPNSPSSGIQIAPWSALTQQLTREAKQL